MKVRPLLTYTAKKLDQKEKNNMNTKLDVTVKCTMSLYLGIKMQRIRRSPSDPIIIIINGTQARSLEPVVTECKEHTIHTQTQAVASRKPKRNKTHTRRRGKLHHIVSTKSPIELQQC